MSNRVEEPRNWVWRCIPRIQCSSQTVYRISYCPDRLLGVSRVQFRHMSRIQDPLAWPQCSAQLEYSATCKLFHPHVSYCVKAISLNLDDASDITPGRGTTGVRCNKTEIFPSGATRCGGGWRMRTLLIRMLTNWDDRAKDTEGAIWLRRFDSTIKYELFRSFLASLSHMVPPPPRDTAA